MTTIHFFNQDLEIIKVQKNLTQYVCEKKANNKMNSIKNCYSVSVYRNGSYQFSVEKNNN